MEAVFLVIHLIAAVSLIIVILIQPSEAGGFMGTGSMSNLMAPRRTADVMTRTTTILAGIFFMTSMVLAIMANHSPKAKSILDVETGPKTEQGTKAPAAPVTAPENTQSGANDNTAPAPAEKKPAKSENRKEPKPAMPKAPATR